MQNRKFREEVKKAERLTEENRRIDVELQKKTSILSNLTEVSERGEFGVLCISFFIIKISYLIRWKM